MGAPLVQATFLMAVLSVFWAYTIGTRFKLRAVDQPNAADSELSFTSAGNFCSIVSTMDMHTVTFRQRMDEVGCLSPHSPRRQH